MESNRKTTERQPPALCAADEANRHLYHPWWSVKEMQTIATLAQLHGMLPVELIREAVAGLTRPESKP